MKNSTTKRIISSIGIIAILAQSFVFLSPESVSAQVPAEYKPNYKFANEKEKIDDILYKVNAKRNNGQAVESFHFSALLQNFTVVFTYLPQTPKNKGVFESCRIGAEELSVSYTMNTMDLFSNNCLSPLQEIFKEMANSYTVQAKAIASPVEGSAPLTVTFDGRASRDEAGNNTIPSKNYFWYYTDTNGEEQAIGKGPTVSHTFKEEGNYIIHLTVRSANANKGIFDGTADISVNVGPQAANVILFGNGKKMSEDNPIKFTSQEAADGLRIDGTATTPLGGRRIMTHQWLVTNSEKETLYKNGGNGAPGSFNLRLLANGSYTVVLAIFDNENNTVKKTYEVIIADPIATIKVAPTQGNTSSVYSFDASTSYSVQSTLKTYTRVISDSEGNTVVSEKMKTLQHKFKKPGDYQARLKVVDELGNTNEEAVTINVNSTPPVPQFTMTAKKERRLPSQFTLDASPSYDVDTSDDNDALSYEWSFSNNDNVSVDHSFDDNKRIIVSFREKGSYKITLSVKDKYGKIEETTKDITIESSLRPNVFAAPISTQLGTSTTFRVKSNKLVANYEWDFGDGTSRKVQEDNIVHTYKHVGQYRVKLTATTAEGEQNDVITHVFIGEANAPIPGFSITNQQAETLIPEGSCVDTDGHTNPAFLVDRFQDITIDGTEAVNVKGGKENLLFYFKPQNGNTAKRQQMRYKFDDVGCQFIDYTVEDTAINKTASTKIWFFVTNAKPKIQNVLMTFPQFGNTYGIGIGQETQKDIFKADVDPLMVKIDAINATDSDGSLSKYKWYYYNIDDPERWLEIKYTPPGIPYVYFQMPRIAGEYRFGVEIYDNDGESSKSEDMIGKGPVVFFPPDTTNNDVPIVTLKIDTINTKVGEQVTMEVISKITSNRPDFAANRTISYDFDGDGERDTITKDTKVTYVYRKIGNYTPKVKVSYRGYARTAEGEKVRVEKGVKAGFLYVSLGNILLVRDTSYGEVTSRKFCTDVRQCRSNANAIIENQTYFTKKYDTPGKYLIKYEIQDAFGNTSAMNNMVIDASKEIGQNEAYILTLPESSSSDGFISVGKTLQNKVLFYIHYPESSIDANGAEVKQDCFIDADISVDSKGDGNPTQNRDIFCNVETLYEYKNIGVGSTYARLYYTQGENLLSKDIPITFVDANVTLSVDKKELYATIDQLLVRLGDKLPDIKGILLQIRNSIIAGDDTSSLTLQLYDAVEKYQGQIDGLTSQQITKVLELLQNKTTISAQGGTIYASARSAVISLFNADRKEEVAKLFEEFDNSSDKAAQKNISEKILAIGNEELQNKKMDQVDIGELEKEMCTIILYHEIPGTACKSAEDTNAQTVSSTEGKDTAVNTSFFRKIAKGVGIGVGILGAGFIILVIIFAIKAKKKQEVV